MGQREVTRACEPTLLQGLKSARYCIAGFSEPYERSVDPSWRQTFFLYVRNAESQTLEVCVEHINEGDAAHETKLGTATLEDLAGLCDGEVHDLHLPLEAYFSSLQAFLLLLSTLRLMSPLNPSPLLLSNSEDAIGNTTGDVIYKLAFSFRHEFGYGSGWGDDYVGLDSAERAGMLQWSCQ